MRLSSPLLAAALGTALSGYGCYAMGLGALQSLLMSAIAGAALAVATSVSAALAERRPVRVRR